MKPLQKQFYIYVHCRPATIQHPHGEPFYVGKSYSTKKLYGRGYDLAPSHRRNPHHKNVVSKHGKENIIIHTHNCKSESHSHANERWMIAYFGRENLVNLTDGGEGVSGLKHTPHTPEFRRALAERNRGNKYAIGNKNALGNKRTYSSKERAGRSVRMLGNQHNLNRKHTPKELTAMSKGIRKAWTPERRAAQAKIMQDNKYALGYKHSRDVEHTHEWCTAHAITMRNHIWINNGTVSKMVKGKIPKGYVKGRLKIK